MRRKNVKKAMPYQASKETFVFGLGLIPKEGVPEIKIRYTRTRKTFLGKVTHSKDVSDFIRRTFKRGTLELQEQFIVLYLNTTNEILGYYKHSIGSINGTIADIRLIFATALASASVAIIVAHNHPSRNAKPSEPDINLTKRLKEAGQILEVRLLDHLIITKQGYYSFADDSML